MSKEGLKRKKLWLAHLFLFFWVIIVSESGWPTQGGRVRRVENGSLVNCDSLFWGWGMLLDILIIQGGFIVVFTYIHPLSLLQRLLPSFCIPSKFRFECKHGLSGLSAPIFSVVDVTCVLVFSKCHWAPTHRGSTRILCCWVMIKTIWK
jgi:hypothetical protein